MLFTTGEITCRMRGERENEQAAEAADEKTMHFFASFYLLLKLGEDFDFALVLSFENRHDNIFCGYMPKKRFRAPKC